VTGTAAPGAGALTAAPASFTLPDPVTGATGVAAGGKVLALGGQDALGHATNKVTAIDPTANTAIPAGTLNTPVTNAASAVVGGTPTVFGGNTKSATDASGATDAVQTYSTGTSQQVGRLPAPRQNLGATTANGKTYLAGGDDGKSPQGDIWETADGRTFKTVGKLDTPVRSPAVATTGTGGDEKVTVFGGQGATGPSDAIQQFDPKAGTVSTVGRLPAALTNAAAFDVNGTTYLAGGQSNGQPQSAIYRFDPTTNSVSPAGNLPDGVRNAAAAATGNKAYLMGGEVKNKVSNSVTQLQPR
jgi:N-acetylneuraminic acid mutarotase